MGDVKPHEFNLLVAILVAHQRMSIGACLCGWDELGASHAKHVAAAYSAALGELT